MGFPILPSTPPIMRSIYLNVDLSKKAIIAQVIKKMPTEIYFTESEINELYDLSVSISLLRIIFIFISQLNNGGLILLIFFNLKSRLRL